MTNAYVYKFCSLHDWQPLKDAHRRLIRGARLWCRLLVWISVAPARTENSIDLSVGYSFRLGKDKNSNKYSGSLTPTADTGNCYLFANRSNYALYVGLDDIVSQGKKNWTPNVTEEYILGVRLWDSNPGLSLTVRAFCQLSYRARNRLWIKCHEMYHRVKYQVTSQLWMDVSVWACVREISGQDG